jgi:hypothetical protein
MLVFIRIEMSMKMLICMVLKRLVFNTRQKANGTNLISAGPTKNVTFLVLNFQSHNQKKKLLQNSEEKIN